MSPINSSLSLARAVVWAISAPFLAFVSQWVSEVNLSPVFDCELLPLREQSSESGRNFPQKKSPSSPKSSHFSPTTSRPKSLITHSKHVSSLLSCLFLCYNFCCVLLSLFALLLSNSVWNGSLIELFCVWSRQVHTSGSQTVPTQWKWKMKMIKREHDFSTVIHHHLTRHYCELLCI